MTQMMKKYLSVMQSAYFFSLLFFSSSLLFILLHTIKPNFSGFPLFSLLRFNIDRNHMFLLCNGILVILVKSSSNSLSSPQEDKMVGKSVEERVVVVLSGERTEVSVSQEQSISGHENVSEMVAVSEFVVDDYEDQDVCEIIDDHKDHDYDDDHDEEEDDLGAEELNKRCEEFIRRMKQGIISESRVDRGLPRF